MNEKKQEVLDPLEPWQQEILKDYLCNEAAKLKRLVRELLHPIGGISQKDEDDFISKSSYFLWKLLYKYDKTTNIPFHNFLKSCLKKRFITWGIRDINRQKNKNIIKYGNDVFEIIPDISLETPINADGQTVENVIADPITVENSIFTENMSNKVENYLAELPRLARQVVLLKIKGNDKDYITDYLHITNKQYADAMAAMKSSEYISILM